MNSRAQERLNELFSEINRLMKETNGSTSISIQKELEELKQRLVQLEAEISNSKDADIKGSLSAQVLYQKDKITYAFSNGKLDSSIPELSSDLTAVPLVVGNQKLGEVLIEKPLNKNLSDDTLSMVETIARQASVQIENLRLLSEAERARLEVENVSRRFIHEGWDNYLDAINQAQRIGYAYDQATVSPFTEKEFLEADYQESVSILNEQIGKLYIKTGRALNENEKALINAVASQMAQQVENIRLLADSFRARNEAQEAVRKLTRENWETYLAKENQTSTAYIYTSNEVILLDEENKQKGFDVVQDLDIRGEVIGNIAIAELDSKDQNTLEWVQAITERLSTHIEALRLIENNAEYTQRLTALAEMGNLFLQASSSDEIYQITAAKISDIIPAERASLTLLDETGQQLAVLALDGEKGVMPTGTILPMEGTAIGQAIKEQRMKSWANIEKSEFKDLINLSKIGLRSVMNAPIYIGEKIIGTLNVASNQFPVYSPQYEVLLTQTAAQISSFINNRQLFNQIQKRAEHEQTLREVNNRVSNSVAVDLVMRRAVEEVGRVLGRRAFIQLEKRED